MEVLQNLVVFIVVTKAYRLVPVGCRRHTMSSLHDSPRYSDSVSADELPDDVETARTIIESLTRQLKIHDDVTSNLILLQKRVQHTHQRTQDAMQMLEDRLDNVEATWSKELEEQHKRWLQRYNQLLIETETTRAAKSSAVEAPTKGSDGAAKLTKSQLESFGRRVKNLDEGSRELKDVSSSSKNFAEKLRLDKERIKNIDSRLKALTKKEQRLNAELTRQMNSHFRKPFTEVAEDRSSDNFYGVCEVIAGYQKAISNLDDALRTLEQIKKVPSLKSIDNLPQNIPSVDEIDEIIIIMRRFIAKLRVQLGATHFTGSPSLENPPMITDKLQSASANVSANIDAHSNSSAAVGSIVSSDADSSDYGTTPLESSQSIENGTNMATAREINAAASKKNK